MQSFVHGLNEIKCGSFAYGCIVVLGDKKMDEQVDEGDILIHERNIKSR